MDPEATLPRRTILAVGGATVTGAALLAGCGGSGGGASGTTAGSASSPSSVAAGQQVIALADVPVGGGAVAATGPGGAKILVAQPTAGTVVAFSAVCTHMGCAVPGGKGKLVCPCHGSTYDANTGAVLSGPAPKNLPQLAVKVDGSNVVTA